MSRIPVHSLDDAPGHQRREAFVHQAVNQFTIYRNHYARAELDLPAAPPLEPS